MSDLKGYLSEFTRYEDAAGTKDLSRIYPDFKNHHEAFNFILSFGDGKFKSDPEAIQLAIGLNPTIAFQLIKKGPSKAGGDYSVIDVVESRHILLLSYLKTHMGNKPLGNVLEIGGGYGNFFRLASEIFEYESWTIADLEFITKLQKWFLEQEKVVMDRVTLMPSTHLVDLMPDLVIGTHSLSEFDLDTFTSYYNRYIKKAKRLLYSSHNTMPSRELLERKMETILTDFVIASSKKYELHQSTMYIFEKK